MPKPNIYRLLPLSRLQITLAALVLLAFGIAISVLSVKVVEQIDRLGESRTGNAQWSLSQIETELGHLVLAADAAQHRDLPLSKVRLRFDVFYSRLATLKNGSVFMDLREKPTYINSFARLTTFLDTMLPLIDGSDQDLRHGLPELYAGAAAAVPDAHAIALAGVEVIAATSDKNRTEVARTLLWTGVLTAVLVATLAGLVVLLLQLYRFNRRWAAENLETLSRLDAIVATALEAIVTVDSAGRIIDFNDAACQTLGYTREEAVGSDMADLIAPLPDGQLLFRKGKAPDFHGKGRVRVTARHKDGRVFPAEMSISLTGEGQAALYVAFLRDLSVQLAAEQALTAARDEALAGEKAKADLLVVMSHEIRTPLNGMIGTIELLETTELRPHQREYLRIMEASGQLLMSHVNDVLDIARLDSGKAPFTLRPTDLSALVQDVMENQQPASVANGNHLSYVAPSDGRSLVMCDGAQLKQVLLNLVGNAVKFTQNGRITIEVVHLGDQGPTEIRVTDTGIGIPKADLGRIFDDFVTLDASYARHVSGTGLGLGIVRRIVNQMGGMLSVKSQEGKGSAFCVCLPLAFVEGGTGAEAANAPLPSMRTLVVEDNEFNRLIVREMLLKDGHLVTEAHDGAEGIALAAEQAFDLILMDISMPRVDGLQAARAIIAGNGPSSHAPIVAMTAHALAEETVRFRRDGMQQVLIKPITRDALRRVLAALHGASVRSGPVVDLALIRALIEDLGPDKADSLMQRFLTEADEIVAKTVACLTLGTQDKQALRDLHRLVGSAAMFGAEGLRRELSLIETAWKRDGTVPPAGLEGVWKDTARAFQDEGIFAQASSLR